MVAFLLSTVSSLVPALIWSKLHHGLGFVPFGHQNRSRYFEPNIERDGQNDRPALSLNICPSYSPPNFATKSSVLKAMYAREYTFSLFSLQIRVAPSMISMSAHQWHQIAIILSEALTSLLFQDKTSSRLQFSSVTQVRTDS